MKQQQKFSLGYYVLVIDSAYKEARRILDDHRDELEAMAALLLEKEKIDSEDIQRILGPVQQPGPGAHGTSSQVAAAYQTVGGDDGRPQVVRSAGRGV